MPFIGLTNRKTMLALTLAAFSLISLAVITSAREGGREPFAPPAQVDKPNEEKCSERTVRGTYAFALTGSVIGVGPIAASGTTTFDGKGKFSITGAINTTTLNQLIEGTFHGTYTVNRDDCTATATVTTPGVFGFTDLNFRAVIVDEGHEIRYLITNPGIVFAGATVRQEQER